MIKVKAAFLFVFSLLFAFASYCQDQIQENSTPDSANFAIFSAEEAEIHLGTVEEGDTVRHTFYFTNTGIADLVLKTVKPSCGCTTPEWSQDPVPPGGKGEIKVVFPSFGYAGEESKTITVIYNGKPPQTMLKFGVTVIEKQMAPPVPGDGKEKENILIIEENKDDNTSWKPSGW
jgi:hypothetical protein